MIRDRRKTREANPQDVKKILNRKQLSALRECQYFGWKLKFIRCPLFQDPVPVLYNAKIDQVGILDADGRINIAPEIQIRSAKFEPDDAKHPCELPKSKVAASMKERRKDRPSFSDNPDGLLNQHQTRALRHIETFGWRLYFVRRSLFHEPVVVIISPEGDRYATLEHDGRINMMPDTELRKEAPVKKRVAAPTPPASEVKRA